ncbi:hypothetical protein Droror1_Dr00024745 [Drosera rotundifolia]
MNSNYIYFFFDENKEAKTKYTVSLVRALRRGSYAVEQIFHETGSPVVICSCKSCCCKWQSLDLVWVGFFFLFFFSFLLTSGDGLFFGFSMTGSQILLHISLASG